MKKYSVRNLGAIGYISELDAHQGDTPPEALKTTANCTMNGTEISTGSDNPYKGGAGAYPAGAFTSDDPITEIDSVLLTTGELLYIGYGSKVLTSNEVSVTTATTAYTWYTNTYTELGNPFTGSPAWYPSGSFNVNRWPHYKPVVATKFNNTPIVTRRLPSARGVTCSPLYMDNMTTGTFNEFPGFEPAGTWQTCTAAIVASYKGFIILANYVDDTGTLLENGIWWCHPQDPGNFPASGDWDYTDPTKLAGRVVVGSASEQILNITPLHDDLIIYTTGGVYRMTFTGGSFVFNITKVSESVHCMGMKSVAEFNGLHFVVDDSGSCFIFDGQSFTNVSEGKVEKDIVSVKSTVRQHTTRVEHISSRNEVWVVVGNAPFNVTTSGTYNYGGGVELIENTNSVVEMPSRVYKYKYTNGTWSLYDHTLQQIVTDSRPDNWAYMHEIAMQEVVDLSFWQTSQLAINTDTTPVDPTTMAGYGCPYIIKELIVPNKEADYVSNLTTFDAAVGDFDSQTEIYNLENEAFFTKRIAYIPATFGDMHYFRFLWTIEDSDLLITDTADISVETNLFATGATPTIITKTDIIPEDDATIVTALWVYPELEVHGISNESDYTGALPKIYIRVGFQDLNTDTPTWGEWNEFDPDTEYRIPVKVTGKRLAIQMYHDDLRKYRLRGFDIMYKPTGRR